MAREAADLARGVADLIASAIGASERQIADRGITSLVELLPVQGAGMTLVRGSGSTEVIVASDPIAYALERLQLRLDEGPCVIAHNAGEMCLAPEVGTDRRFARYGVAAAEIGVNGVFAFPLRRDAAALGTVDLYTRTAGNLSEEALLSARAISDALAGLLVNVRERTQLEADLVRLREIAGHDPLTGLANRRLLLDRIDQALRRRARSGRTVAVAFIDLDNFKAVNDRHGHRAGDALLVSLARRLSNALRPSDTLARLSGDEFVVLFEDLSAADELRSLLARIDDLLRAAFTIDDIDLYLTASYGCAVSANPDDSGEDLIGAADRAMYAHKQGNSSPTATDQSDVSASPRPAGQRSHHRWGCASCPSR